MTVHMVRFTTAPEAVDDVESGIAALFAAVADAAPSGVRFRYYRATATGPAAAPEFVAWLELADGVDNPLPSIPAAREYQASLAGWAATPPAPTPLTLLAAYPEP